MGGCAVGGASLDFLRRTWTEISLDNLAFNYMQIQRHVPEKTKIMGIVKADAYGHGAVPVSRQLEALGAGFLAVSNLEEAVQLRKGGIGLPILLLGYTPPQFAPYEAEQEIRQEVHSLSYAGQLNEALQGSGKRLKIHLKLDTGMSRLGFFAYDCPDTLQELEEIARMSNLQIEGAFQHFSVADSYDAACQAFTRLQYTRFCELLEKMKQCGIEPPIRHCCNSAATILHPEYAMDMVRPGIALYGIAPDKCMEGAMELHPVLSWRTAISQIRPFPTGISISYGRIWTTPDDCRIAVVPIGYADGLQRNLSGQLTFLLRGKPVQQVGRICMDMCMLDITGVPEAEVGDTVTVIGCDGTQRRSCADMARQLGTIDYEITCNISKRVPRIYLKDGQRIEKLQYIP